MARHFIYIFAVCLFLFTTSSYAEEDLDFTVPSRVDNFEFMPCSACHEYTEPNPTQRYLEEAPHYAEIKHGSAQMWCTNCHSLESRDKFITPSGQLVDLDKGYLLCAQCHNETYRHWKNGAHGKRIGNWQGERQIHSCMACHNPHHGPAIEPRSPYPPPGVRKGMSRAEVEHPERRCRFRWEQCVYQDQEAEDAE